VRELRRDPQAAPPLEDRVVGQAGLLADRVGFERAYELLGHRLDPSYCLPKWMWLREHVPEAWSKATGVLVAKDALTLRLIHELEDLVALLDRHHGTEVIALIDARAHLHGSKGGAELLGELSRERLVNIEAIGGRARGTSVAHLGDHGACDCLLDIVTLEHEEGCIASEFHG
jgi:hypothetical protein